jgi:TolB protein
MDQDVSELEPAELAESDPGLDFREFFEGEHRRLGKALFLMTGDPYEDEELAQEALVRVFERWDWIRQMHSPTGYLYRTAMNLSRSRVRRLASRARHAFSPSPEADPLAGVEARDEVRRLPATLRRGQREAVVLLEWLDMGATRRARSSGSTDRRFGSSFRGLDGRYGRWVPRGMNELRDLLERGAGQFEAPPGGWDRQLRPAGRRRAVRRVTAGVVALAVAGGGIGVVMAAFRGTEHRKPAAAVENGPIAYVLAGSSDWDIYTVTADGTGRMRLTDERGWDQESTWSPDGTSIAFTTFRPNVEGNPAAIWVMNADGTDQHVLVPNGFGPSWSPDGHRIVFSRDVDGNVDIYVINVDGSGLVRLTDDPARDVSSTWAPDSAQIAFVRANGSGFGPLYVMNADGSNGSEVLSDPLVGDPRWSPVQDRIVFETPRGSDPDGPTDLFFVNADGTGLRRLTDDEARELSPSWSPDGSKLAFSSDKGGVRQIYVMNADGSGLTEVTSGEDPAAFPACGPMPSQPASPSITSSPMPKPTGTPHVTAEIQLPDDSIGGGLAVGAGSAWAGLLPYNQGGGDAVIRIDLATNRIVAEIPVDRGPSRKQIAATDDAVWVALHGVLERIDPATNAVVARVNIPGRDISAITADATDIWAVTIDPSSGGMLVRVDASANDVVAQIPLGRQITGYEDEVELGAGSVWVLGSRWNEQEDAEYGSDLIRVDPSTNAVAARIPVDGFRMVVTEDAVWVRFPADAVFDETNERWLWTKVDVATNEPSQPFALDTAGLKIVTPEALWSVDYDEQENVRVTRFDPQTLAVQARSAPIRSLFHDAVLDPASASVWVSAVHTIVRVDIG